MTYRFSRRSLERLEGVHPDLVSCVHEVMSWQVMDFSVIEGVRSADRQRKLFEAGRSTTLNSKHLIQPDGFAHAVDLYPYPIDMGLVDEGDVREIARFGILAGLMARAAQEIGVLVVNGMDWDGDGQTLDHTFFDAPHFQLVQK